MLVFGTARAQRGTAQGRTREVRVAVRQHERHARERVLAAPQRGVVDVELEDRVFLRALHVADLVQRQLEHVAAGLRLHAWRQGGPPGALWMLCSRALVACMCWACARLITCRGAGV
jgi:hypothetical protein